MVGPVAGYSGLSAAMWSGAQALNRNAERFNNAGERLIGAAADLAGQRIEPVEEVARGPDTNPDSRMATAAVDMVSAEIGYTAGAAVVKASDRMFESLLDIFA